MYSVQINPAVFSDPTISPNMYATPQEYRGRMRITLDAYDGAPANYEWTPRPTTVGTPVDAPIVRERRALYVGVHPIYLENSIVEGNWTANDNLAHLLSHYITKGIIVVKKDGTVVTTAQLDTITKS